LALHRRKEEEKAVTLRPLAAFTLAFGTGVWAAASMPALIWLGLAALAAMCVLLLLTRRRVWLPYALTIAAGLVGSLNYGLHARRSVNDVSTLAPSLVTLTGVVESDTDFVRRDADLGPAAAHLTLRILRIESAASSQPDQRNANPFRGSVDVRLTIRAAFRETRVPQKMPHYGDTLSVYGRLELPSGPRNPGGFDRRTYLNHQGIYSTLVALRPEDWHVVADAERSGSPFLTLAYTVRQAILRRGVVGLSPERAAVLSGILLGDRTNLPADLREDFERTGTTHILATAGLHVGLVMALLLGLLRILRLPRKPALGITLLCLALYIPMTGERVAMTRAAIMAAVYLGGMLLEREPYLPNTLSLAALLLLIGSPQSLFEAGFQLSFCIVITIALVMPLLQNLRKSLPREALPAGKSAGIGKFALDIFLIALAAQIGALPLAAYYFHAVPLVGIVANVLIVPVVLPILGLGFLATLLGSIAPILAVPLDRTLDYLLAYIVSMTHAFASPDWASLPVGEFSPLIVVAAYAVLWGGAWYLSHQLGKRRSPAEA
jgi:ComEC/Rec2-related protein